MPCRTDYDDPCEGYRNRETSLRQEVEFFKAALCASLRALEHQFGTEYDEMYKVIDLKEAGISHRDLKSWYETHKAEDVERRERERAARLEENRLKKLKQSALRKLSPEEKKVLGIK